ncbi:MAG: hypothetical protein ACPLXS_02340 [Candidatus Micrarchaeales archaeon]
MEKEDKKIEFLRILFNREEDFDIRGIKEVDGKKFVEIEAFTIRKEDFANAKKIQDFLGADGIIFKTRIRFNEDWQGEEAKEYLKEFFDLKEIIFKEAEVEEKIFDKIIKAFKKFKK